MSARMVFAVLFIKQRLALTDEEIIEQMRENACVQFFLSFDGYPGNVPFVSSMMVPDFPQSSVGCQPSILSLEGSLH